MGFLQISIEDNVGTRWKITLLGLGLSLTSLRLVSEYPRPVTVDPTVYG